VRIPHKDLVSAVSVPYDELCNHQREGCYPYSIVVGLDGVRLGEVRLGEVRFGEIGLGASLNFCTFLAYLFCCCFNQSLYFPVLQSI